MKKAVVIFDTKFENTGKIAKALESGIEKNGLRCNFFPTFKATSAEHDSLLLDWRFYIYAFKSSSLFIKKMQM
jgi:hypothetical protein